MTDDLSPAAQGATEAAAVALHETRRGLRDERLPPLRCWSDLPDLEKERTRYEASETVAAASVEPAAESRSILRMKAHTSGTCPICSREMAAAEPSEDAVERAARALIEREADQMEQDTDGIATLDRWDECEEPTREEYRDKVRLVLVRSGLAALPRDDTEPDP